MHVNKIRSRQGPCVFLAATVLLGLTLGAPGYAAENVEPPEVVLQASDGVRVFADHVVVEGGRSRPLILLFHQAGSNASEYEPIVPRLSALGLDTLTVDSRSGGRMFDRNNRTVMALGRAQPFDAAYADLKAAAAWADDSGYEGVVAWGSSYTAALVFRLAAEDKRVRAVLSFSPGEHLGAGERVRGYAASVHVPVFVTSAPGVEIREARRIVEVIDDALVMQYEPRVGVHGSSALRKDRNPDAYEAYWTEVNRFLAGPVFSGRAEVPEAGRDATPEPAQAPAKAPAIKAEPTDPAHPAGS